MGKLINDSNGFGALEGLLILVIVALVGFTGWYVWHAQQNANKNFVPTSSGNPAFKKLNKTPAKTTTTSPSSTTYLDIKELGIKLPLTSGINDLAYSWDGKNAVLDSKSFDTFVKQTDPTCLGTSGQSNYGEIFTSSTPPPVGNPVSVNVGSKTYYYAGPQQGCGPEAGGSTVNDRTTGEIQAIEAAFKQAEAD